jgi:hypothetical protein
MITQMPRWSDGGCVDGQQDLRSDGHGGHTRLALRRDAGETAERRDDV